MTFALSIEATPTAIHTWIATLAAQTIAFLCAEERTIDLLRVLHVDRELVDPLV